MKTIKMEKEITPEELLVQAQSILERQHAFIKLQRAQNDELLDVLRDVVSLAGDEGKRYASRVAAILKKGQAIKTLKK